MLDLFRKRGLTSFVYGFIIVATVAVFIIQFRPNAGQRSASLKQSCVAMVKGWCITPKEQQGVYNLLMPRSASGPLRARARQMGLARIVGDGLIERELLVSEADRLGLRIGDDEVTDSIYDGQIYVSVPSDKPELAPQFPVANGRILPQMTNGFRDPKTKNFDLKTYERTVRFLLGQSATEFREAQNREILASKVRDVVRAPIRVSEAEAFESYNREKSHASVTYVPVKAAYMARYAVASSPADVDAWAADKANADAIDAAIKAMAEDMKPKAGHIRHILVKVEADATDDDRTAALAKLADAMRRVKSGERFADVAKEVSQDYGSGAKGGDVGDKTDGFVAPFRKAADALKPGEMTPAAIESQFGFHAILRDDPESLKRDVTRALYVKAKATDAARELAGRIDASMKAGTSAETAVKNALEPIVKKGTTLPAIAAVRDPHDAAADAGAPTDKADKSAKTAKADGGAPADGPLFARVVSADDDPNKPHVEASSAFNRGGDPISGLSPDANAKVLSFAFEGKDNDVMAEPLRTDDGYEVIQLRDHKTATRDEFDKDRETYLQTLLTQKQAEALSLYVKRLRETAKNEIKVDETLMQEKGTNRDGGAPPPDEGEEE